MDISKFRIPTLNGLNWGLWLDHIQSTMRILDIWDAMRGDIITTNLLMVPLMQDLLQIPITNRHAGDCCQNYCLHHHKSHLEQEEHTRIRSHPGHSVKHDMAETPVTRYHKRGTRCLGDQVWSRDRKSTRLNSSHI